MEYIFNPLNNKIPAGPCKAGEDVTYTLRVSRHSTCDLVFFVLIDDSTNSKKEIKMPLHRRDGEYNVYQITITFDAGLYWYYFKITYDKYTWYLRKTALFDAEPVPQIGESFAQIVYQKTTRVDKQYNSGIIYHIFVDRFRKGAGIKSKEGIIPRSDWGGEIAKNTKDFSIINKECFGGNLQGIIDKLDYIKGLGTTTIMLSPIFESNSYHKYDTVDLENVDSMFGGNELFMKLIAEAKKQGISILLDGVFNHCGSDSIYFKDAIKSQTSKYYDWFTFEKYPSKYLSWWGFETLPQFNANSVQVQNFIAGQNGIIEKHMRTGILGFRLDVADELAEPYLNKICSRIRQVKPDALILGEVWEDAATKIAYNKRRAYFNGNQLNSVMNYPLKNAIIDFVINRNAEGLASVFYMLRDHYPNEIQNNLMNFLGTHDTKRILTVLGQNNPEYAFNLLKIASAIQYCSPGVPALFYGDEAGVQGGDAPFCRVCFPWGKENKEILKWYRKLGALRADEIFRGGDCNVLYAHSGVFIMERKYKNKRIVLAANCGADDFKLNIESAMINFETAKTVKDSLLLHPYEFVILHQ